MTAGTHIVFALSIGAVFGVDERLTFIILGVGAILPDIDHPRSIMGRIVPFLSHRIHRKFGHRNLLHSLIFWLPITLVAFKFNQILFFLCMGALSHLILDCWNLSGVALFTPVSEKIFVLSGRTYRISSGSSKEFIISIILLIVLTGGLYISEQGGVRTIVRKLLGEYNMVYQDYEKRGLKICDIEGKFRFKNGMIKEVKWVIIGKNGKTGGLSFFDPDTRICYQVPMDGKFLHVVLEEQKREWRVLKLKDFMTIAKGESFYFLGDRWRRAEVGSMVVGEILYLDELEMDRVEI